MGDIGLEIGIGFLGWLCIFAIGFYEWWREEKKRRAQKEEERRIKEQQEQEEEAKRRKEKAQEKIKDVREERYWLSQGHTKVHELLPGVKNTPYGLEVTHSPSDYVYAWELRTDARENGVPLGIRQRETIPLMETYILLGILRKNNIARPSYLYGLVQTEKEV